MSQITSLQVIRDHLAMTPGTPKKKRLKSVLLAVLCLVLALVPGYLFYAACVETTAIAALLTATSIMTGLTFTMAMRFWERSLDARSNPDLIFDQERKEALDNMRTIMLWTVLAGLLSTAWLATLAILIGPNAADRLATAVSATVVAYQLIYVLRSLLALYWASYKLRP